MGKGNIKAATFRVTSGMCKKVHPVIKENDIIEVSFSKKDKPIKDKFVLISDCERQWIERYKEDLNRNYQNIYLITKIIMS